MADYDGDVKLSVSLKPTHIKKSAANLQKAIAGVFESTKGKEVSKPVEKLQIALDKASNKAQVLVDKMNALRVPTKEYEALDKKLKSIMDDYTQISKSASTMEGGPTKYMVSAMEHLKKRYAEVLAEKQKLYDSGKAYQDNTATDQQKYDQLALKLSETNNQMLSLLKTYSQVSTEEEGAKQAAAGFAEVMNQLGQYAEVADQDIVDLVSKQDELSQKLDELTAKQQVLEAAGVGEGYLEWERTTQAIAETEAELNDVTSQIEAYREEISTLPEPKEPATFANFIKFLGRNLVDVGEKASTAFGKFVDGASNAARSLGGNLSNALHKVKALITKTFNGRSIKRGFMTVLRYTLGIRSLYILVNKVRAAVKEAINNMAQWNDGNNDVNRSMTAITSSLTAFKNSIGVAVAPLLNMLAPALEMIIDLATQAANAIGRFFAALTGASTVMQAVKVQKDYAESLGGTASGSKKAGKETDKLHDKLASFDDLNVLGKDKEDESASGGGGGAGSSVQDMFTEIETPISNLAEKLKEAITNGDFSGIGQAIGEKIRDSLNSIDWDGIKEKLSEGISMATSFINGVLTTDGLFSSIGTNAAEGINTFVSGIRQFINEIDWKEILKGVGEGITNFFGTLDFGEILLTVGDGIIAALEGLSGFLDGLDLKTILDSVVTGVKDFLTTYDWSQLFYGLGSLLGESAELVTELVSWLGEAIGNMLINAHEYFWPFVEPYLEDLPEDAGFVDIGLAIVKGLTEGTLEGLKDIGTWLYDNVFKPIYDGICDAFDINSPSKVMEEVGGYLVEGLMNAITTIPDKVMEVFEDLKTKLVETWTAIKTKAIFMWNMFKLGLVTIATSIKTAVTTPFTNMKTFIINTISSLKTKVISLWNAIWSGIKGVINKILGGIESFCNGIIDGINDIMDTLNVVDDLPDAVKEYLDLDDFSLPKLEHIEIPRLAQGAVIPPNREFLAMLGDQKSGTNIEAPLDTIVDAFRQAMGSGYQQNGNAPIILQIDGQTIGRVLAPNLMNELGRLGYNVKVLEG